MSARVAALTILGAAIIVGAWLRFHELGTPSFWLDEILHQHLTAQVAAQPWWRWFGAPHEEHGSLYYLTQLAARAFGTGEAAGRSAAALLGVLTIPVVWAASRTTRVSAILLAVAPLHVYYSREARSYALVMLLTALLILTLLRARSIVALCAVLLGLLATAAVAAPVVLASVVVAALCAVRTRDRWWWNAAGASVITLVLFRIVYSAKPAHDAAWPGFPSISRAFLESLAHAFTSPHRFVAAAMLVFAIIGAVVVIRTAFVDGIVLIGMTVLPLAISIASLRFFDHFYAIRYVTPALIGFVLLCGAGIHTTALWIVRNRETVAVVIAGAVAVALMTKNWRPAKNDPFRKLDWRAIAAVIRENAKPGEFVLAAEPWSEVSLRYYLGDSVPVIGSSTVGLTEMLLRREGAKWIVSAGFSGDDSVRSWICRYPIVMSSALESFRLHYVGTQRELLARARPETLRAVAASFRTIGPQDSIAFGEGWADPESEFRWAIARRATLSLVRSGKRDATIRVNVLPLPPQAMRVSLNGNELGRTTLANEWRTYSFAAPAGSWVEGINTVAFEFDHATSPGANDPRTLAACVTSIAVDDSSSADRPLVPMLRIDAGRFLDASALWRDTNTRFPAAGLNRRGVEALLGRLGFDPRAGWPPLANGEVHLDDVIETLADGSDCEDDATFLTRAFAVLLERPPNRAEESDFIRQLQAGTRREAVLGRIAKSREFRSLTLSFASR